MADHLDVPPDARAALAVVEHRVGAVDAGVDDRDRDAGASELVAGAVAVEVDGSLVHVVATGGPVRGVGERLELAVGPVDTGDVGGVFQGADLGRGADRDHDPDPVEHRLHEQSGPAHGVARGSGVPAGLHHHAYRLQASDPAQLTGQLGTQDGPGVDDRFHRRGAGHAGAGVADQGVGGQRDERGAGRGGGDCGAHHQPRGGTAGHGSSLVRGRSRVCGTEPLNVVLPTGSPRRATCLDHCVADVFRRPRPARRQPLPALRR